MEHKNTMYHTPFTIHHSPYTEHHVHVLIHEWDQIETHSIIERMKEKEKHERSTRNGKTETEKITRKKEYYYYQLIDVWIQYHNVISLLSPTTLYHKHYIRNTLNLVSSYDYWENGKEHSISERNISKTTSKSTNLNFIV